MKALIKHELRNIWMILLYFIGTFTLGVGCFAEDLAADYNSYLWNGYHYDTATNLLDTVSRWGQGYMLMMALGLLVLLYVQFKDNKSVSVSCFIKSLPYTNQQIYGVKLGCGILSFTVPFVVAYSIIVGIGQSHRVWLSMIEQISPVGERLVQLNRIDQLLLYGLLIYSVTLMVYLLGFWMQYLVNSNIASLIITSCSLVGIPYFIYMLSEYLLMIFRYETGGNKVQGLINMLQELGALVWLPNYMISHTPGVEIVMDGNMQKSEYIHTLVQMESVGIKILLMLLISLILFLAIVQCNQTYRAENQERFMGYRWAQTGLKVGVTGCAAGLAIPFVGLVGVNQRVEILVLHGVIILFGAIGYGIIHRICKIGQK